MNGLRLFSWERRGIAVTAGCNTFTRCSARYYRQQLLFACKQLATPETDCAAGHARLARIGVNGHKRTLVAGPTHSLWLWTAQDRHLLASRAITFSACAGAVIVINRMTKATSISFYSSHCGSRKSTCLLQQESRCCKGVSGFAGQSCGR